MTQLFHIQGWYVQNTEGIGTVYLASIDEGLLTTETDTPPSAELSEGILRELRAAIRGRPLHELSSGLNASQDAVMRACGELLSQGAIVRRGLKYFVA